LALIKNIIQTQFTSTGSGAVNKQVETLNKNQTRLAQSSASAGRSFAAQSQGLGGLVGAYAGAAATTFALQQAFSKLAAAARAEQTLEGLKSLATASGESSSILLKNVREITKNQLTLAEAAQQINLSLSAGFDQRQIEGLATVAIKASRALGRDLTDAYTRVIRGSAKLETELLDELGIYTKIGPSTRAYAAALNRSAESLTEFERRQAFVNSVIAEGNRKFSSINTTIPTSAERLEAFGVKIVDVATQMGILLANYLAPLADFLTNNFAGSLAAVGTLLALISKTAVGALGSAIGKLETKIESFTSKTSGWLAKNGGDWQGYSKKAQEAMQSVNTQMRGLNKAEQSQLSALRETSKQRALTSSELKSANDILKKREDSLTTLTATQTKELAVLTASRAAGKLSQDQTKALDTTINNLTKRLEINQAILASTTAQTKLFGAAQAATGARIAAVTATVASGFSTLVVGTVSAGRALLGLTSGFLGVVSIASLVGSSIAGLMGKQEAYNALLKEGALALGAFFNPGAGNSTQESFNALAAAALEDMSKVDATLRDIDTFKIKDKVFGISVDVEKTKEDLVREVGAIFEEVAKDGQKTFTESFASGSAATGGLLGYIFGGSIIRGIASFVTARGLTMLGGALGTAFGGPIGTAVGAAIGAAAGAAFEYYFSKSLDDLDPQALEDALITVGRRVYNDPEAFAGINETLAQALYKIEEQYGALAEASFAGREYYRIMVQVAEAIGDSSNNLEILTDLSKALGISIVDLKKNFTDLTSGNGNIQLIPKLDIPDISLPALTITIQDEKAVLSRLATISDIANELASSYFITPEQTNSVLTLSNAIGDLAAITQTASTDILLANNNLQSFRNAVDDGSITLEKFAENEAAVSKSLIRAGAALDVAKDKLAELKDQRAAAEELGIPTQLLEILNEEIRLQSSIVAEISKGIGATQERLGILLTESQALRDQLKIKENITTLFDAELKTKLDLLAVDQASGALAATSFEKDLARAAFLQDILEKNKESYDARLKFETDVNEVLKAAGKDQIGLQSEIFSLVGNTGQARLAEIDAAYGLNGALSSLNTLSSDASEEANNYNDALKVVKVTALEIYEALRKGTEEFDKQLKQVERDISEFVAEDRIVKLRLEAETLNLNYEAVQAQLDAQIASLQSQIDIVEALADLDNFATVDSIVAEVNAALANTKVQVEVPKELQNLSAVEAAKTVTQKQYEILALQIDAENKRYLNELQNIAIEKDILKQEYALEVSRREAEKQSRLAEIEVQRNNLTALASTYVKSLTQQEGINQILVEGLARVFSEGASRIALAVGAAAPPGIAVPKMGLGEAAIAENITAAAKAYAPAFDKLTSSIEDFYSKTAYAAAENHATALDNFDEQADAAAAAHAANLEGFRNDGIAIGIAGRQALKTIADENAKQAEDDAKKRAEALEEMQKIINETGEKIKELTKQLAQQILDTLGGVVTSVMQKKVDLLAAQETMISDTLSLISAKTEEASNKLQQTLEKENSLREEVASKTEAVNKSYTDFIDALVSSDGKIQESGKEYVSRLLEQKNSIMELNKAGSARIAQEGAAKTLEEMKIDLEKRLEEVTANRIKADEKLQKTQETLSVLSDLLNSKFTQMTSTITQLSQAIGAFNSMGGVGGAAGIGFQPIVNKFADAVKQFNKAAETAGTASKQSTEASTNIAGAGKNIATAFNQNVVKAMDLFGAALDGFNLGSMIGQLTGDMGMGSSIGGAIGGIVSAIPAFSNAIAGAITGALGKGFFATALGAAIPVLGPIIGALLGGLFSKKPRGQAQGTLTSEGFETTSMSGRKIDVKALASIAEASLTGVISSLAAAGISFSDTVNTSISYYKKGINGATLEFANGFKASFEGGTAEQAGKFFVDSFFQGLRIGSLTIDESMPAADRIQAAIDRFATLADVAEKTAERLDKAIQFASEFDTSLAELSGTGSSVAQIFKAINNAALANANNVGRYYSDFLADTKEVFGEASSEYEEAYNSVVDNALAQIGLAKDLEGNIISVAEAMKGLNVGSIIVREAIANIQAFSTVLEELEIPDVDTIITQAINAKLTTLVTDVGDALSSSIEKLKEPTYAAAFELRDMLEESAARISDLQGIYDQLNKEIGEGTNVNADIVTGAADNIAKATELAALQVDAYINTLDKSGLKAIITNEAWGNAAALAAAETRLATILEYERIQAIVKFVEVSRNFRKKLAEISGQMVDISKIPISFTAITDVMKAFDQQVSTSLTNSFTGFLNSIGKGEDITTNFEDAITLLNDNFISGELDSIAYANGLEMLQEVSVSVLEEIKSMVDEYESLLNQIANSYTDSKNTVISAIQQLGEDLISLTQNITDQTSEILGIYDDTLASVAESGNELFDLRDTAKEAFSTAAKAVAEFEKSNKLSGKSSAALRGEIVSVQSQLDQLLAGGSLDFAGFAQFTELSAKQNALKKELKSLVTVEAEYEALLATRSSSQEDLAFVEATLATLNDELIDTRVKESDIIKKTKDSTQTFLESQQDLRTITELLSESNFNLNQVRIDEESVINRMRAALNEFNRDTTSLTEILTVVGGVAGAALRDSFIEAARQNAEIMFASLADPIRNQEVATAVQGASDAFTQLENLIGNIASYFQPANAISQSLITVSNASIALTDRFEEFSDDLVRYLDQEGLSQFYGQGGIFSQFRDSLLTTLQTDGFDVLTASGGPMESFNLNLMTIGTAINTLTQSGNFLNVSIQAVETSFGNLISAVGTDLEGLTSAFVGLSVVNQTIGDIETAALQLILEDVGQIGIAMDSLGNLDVNLDAFTSLDELYGSILVVESTLNNINFEVAATSAVNSITSAIEVVNSSIQEINIDPATQNIIGQVNSFVTAINSTLQAVNINVDTTGIVNSVTTALSTLNSTLQAVNINVSATSAVNSITTAISTIDSTLQAVNVQVGTTGFVNSINTAISTINSTLQAVNISTAATSAVNSVTTAISTIGSTLQAVNINVAAASAVNSITTAISTIDSTLQAVNINVAAASAVNSITTAIGVVNSAIEELNIDAVSSWVLGQISTFISAINSDLPDTNISVRANQIIGQIVTVISALDSGISNINFDVTLGSAVQEIINIQTTINSALNGITFGVSIANINSTIASIPTSINTQLNGVNFTASVTSLNARISSMQTSINTQLDAATFATNIDNLISRITGIRTAITTQLDATTFSPNVPNLVSRINQIGVLTNTGLDAVNFTTSTTNFVNRINGVGSAINTSLNASTLTNIKETFDALLAVFDTGANTSISNFKTSIDAFKDLTLQINSVTGLAAQINALSNPTTGATATLITRFKDLQTQIQTLTGTTGVEALRTQITKIATDLATAWGKVKLEVDKLDTDISVTVASTLSSTDSATLKRIADNSGKAKVLDKSGLKYTTVALAEGGPVSGPGTSTSDSIPARLSDGEYVIKASSAKIIGKDILSMINSGASMEEIFSKLGRYNDTMVAHITPEEAEMLKRAGGSGTRNPRTGLYEFFNPEAGALVYGGLFDAEEKAYLNTAYGTDANAANTMYKDGAHFGAVASLANSKNSYQRGFFTVNPLAKDYGLKTEDLFDSTGWATERKRINAVHMGLNDMRNAREKNLIGELTSGYGGKIEKKKKNWLNAILGAIVGAILAVVTGGLSLVAGAALGGAAGLALTNNKLSVGAVADGVTAGYKDSNNYSVDADRANKVLAEGKLLKQFDRSSNLNLRSPAVGNSALGSGDDSTSQDYFAKTVDKLNSIDPLFFDFYMLGDAKRAQAAKTIYGNISAYDKITSDNRAYGGLVTKSAQKGMLGKRDSVSAMLEPGEFILRKPIVEKLGIDTLNKINAGSGDFGGDVNVEVNITNNGTPVNAIATPVVRRENEKIIVDVILEDIRTNGPIRQQIRSIR
jgi:hypothetical protein